MCSKINALRVKNKERTFFEIMKRFFEPVFLRKIMYLKYSFVSIIWGINGIFNIYFLERITYYLQKSDTVNFNKILQYYIIFIIIYEIISYFIKKWGWVETIPLGVSDMYKKYLNKYIILDNNKIETIGTGKLIGIFQSGTFKWLELLGSVFEQGISLIVTFIFTIYMIIKVDLIYSFIFLLLVIIFFAISFYFNSKMIPFRKIRYEYRNLRLKNIVKII